MEGRERGPIAGAAVLPQDLPCASSSVFPARRALIHCERAAIRCFY
jgi:hypothetical protein